MLTSTHLRGTRGQRSLALPIKRNARGFSLVEMMVALALGLIVVTAVLALVLSIIRSNRQTLQSTRLNQELRATLAVIASDLRRARSVEDPLTTALLVSGNPYSAMRANGSCMVYAYDGAVDGPWHIVRLENGHIRLEGSTTNPATCTPGGTATQIGSNQVEITDLSFTPTTTSSVPPLATDETVVRQFDISITGHLVDADANVSGVSRTMSQTVYVRSVGTGI
jgi:prepilin-type N-terminal cleavage/methylation domain-containing protein